MRKLRFWMTAAALGVAMTAWSPAWAQVAPPTVDAEQEDVQEAKDAAKETSEQKTEQGETALDEQTPGETKPRAATDQANEESGEARQSAERRQTPAREQRPERPSTRNAQQQPGQASQTPEEAVQRGERRRGQAGQEVNRERNEGQTESRARRQGENARRGEAGEGREREMELGASLRVEETGRMTVSTIEEESIAARAGLREGDQIVSVDGRAFESEAALHSHLRRVRQPRIPVVIIRGGQRETVYIHNTYIVEQGDRPHYHADGERAGLGVTLADSRDGVWIRSVYPYSPADEAGLRPGDMLISVDGEEIRESRDVIEIVREFQPGDRVEIEFARRGDERMVNATLASWSEVVSRRGFEAGVDGRFFGRYAAMRPDMNDAMRIEELERRVEMLRRELSEVDLELEQLRDQPAGDRRTTTSTRTTLEGEIQGSVEEDVEFRGSDPSRPANGQDRDAPSPPAPPQR